jgi:hypothetical protein
MSSLCKQSVLLGAVRKSQDGLNQKGFCGGSFFMPEAPETYTIFLHYLLYICGANCLAIPTPQRYHVTCQRQTAIYTEETKMRNDLTMKELKLHTLIGDIQECAMSGMNKRQIRRLLETRYVNLDTDITEDEFTEVLDREYKKVMERCNSK